MSLLERTGSTTPQPRYTNAQSHRQNGSLLRHHIFANVENIGHGILLEKSEGEGVREKFHAHLIIYGAQFKYIYIF